MIDGNYVDCRRLRHQLVVMVFLIVPISGVAPVFPDSTVESPDQLTASHVNALIDELNAETRMRRATAEKSLLELGPRILPLLPPPELLPTASVREAVSRVRTVLERQKAVDSSRASLVTLNGSRSLPGWLDEIQRQTKNRVTLDPVIASRLRRSDIEARFGDKPFWATLDQLTDIAGKHSNESLLTRFDLNNQLVLSTILRDGGVSPTRITYSGPFRIRATSAQRRKIFGADRRELLRVGLVIEAEPRLRPLFLQVAAGDLAAAVDEGLLLKPFTPDARHEFALSQGRRHAEFQADFELPGSSRGLTLDLRGRAVMTIAADSEAIRFSSLHELVGTERLGIARRRGGVTVTLDRVSSGKATGESADIRLQTVVSYDAGGPAFESHRTWIIYNEAWLETKDGTRVAMTSQETTLQADGAVGLEYMFKNLPLPLNQYQFIYVAPTLIIDIPIDFTLKAIPVGK